MVPDLRIVSTDRTSGVSEKGGPRVLWTLTQCTRREQGNDHKARRGLLAFVIHPLSSLHLVPFPSKHHILWLWSLRAGIIRRAHGCRFLPRLRCLLHLSRLRRRRCPTSLSGISILWHLSGRMHS